jgi:hypothetical protein
MLGADCGVAQDSGAAGSLVNPMSLTNGIAPAEHAFETASASAASSLGAV